MQNSFCFICIQQFCFFLGVFFPGTICLVFANNGTRTCRMVFATLWHGHVEFCMVFATFGHVCLPFCMGFATCWHSNLSIASYLLHFGTSNVHVGFLRVSSGPLGFHLYRVSFKVSLGFFLGFHLWFL